MNNYEYIIACLPDITPDWHFPEGQNADTIIEEIRSQCSSRDNKIISCLTDGFVDENLDRDFYLKALKSPNRFIREYFALDLNMRNAKVAYLNEYLGRPEGQDMIVPSEEDDLDPGVFEEGPKVEEILRSTDILGKERGLDDVMWEKISSITTFDWFNIEVILAFIAKLHIVNRWLILDDRTGRELLKKLVTEVRGTFGGVEYKEV